MATRANEVQTEEVLYEVSDRVATITFNRAELQNTISGPMLSALSRYLLEANDDPDIRAIVITGSGRFFCAGLDLRGAASPTAALHRTPGRPIWIFATHRPRFCTISIPQRSVR